MLLSRFLIFAYVPPCRCALTHLVSCLEGAEGVVRSAHAKVVGNSCIWVSFACVHVRRDLCMFFQCVVVTFGNIILPSMCSWVRVLSPTRTFSKCPIRTQIFVQRVRLLIQNDFFCAFNSCVELYFFSTADLEYARFVMRRVLTAGMPVASCWLEPMSPAIRILPNATSASSSSRYILCTAVVDRVYILVFYQTCTKIKIPLECFIKKEQTVLIIRDEVVSVQSLCIKRTKK